MNVFLREFVVEGKRLMGEFYYVVFVFDSTKDKGFVVVVDLVLLFTGFFF